MKRGQCPCFLYFTAIFWRCLRISILDHKINDEIRDKEVRLIDSDGTQLGIVALKDAMKLSGDKDLDLVMIAPTARPPVCRIMDYGKFRFEKAKKEKESRKNQHVVEVKEIRMTPGTDVHDFNFKLKNGVRFLTAGDKLKVAVRFRGRELTHASLGEQLLIRFAEGLKEVGVMDKAPKLEGRHMTMFFSPNPPEKA